LATKNTRTVGDEEHKGWAHAPFDGAARRTAERAASRMHEGHKVRRIAVDYEPIPADVERVATEVIGAAIEVPVCDSGCC
jgi:hypothetical protein